MANEYLGPTPRPLPEDILNRLQEVMATPTPFRAPPTPLPPGYDQGGSIREAAPGSIDEHSSEILKKIINDVGSKVGSSVMDTFFIKEDGPRQLGSDFGKNGVFTMKEGDVLPESFRKISRPEMSSLRTEANYGNDIAGRARMIADATGGDIGKALMSLFADSGANKSYNEARAGFAKQVDKIETDNAELQNDDLKRQRINNAIWGLPADVRDKVMAEYNAAQEAQAAARPQPKEAQPQEGEDEGGFSVPAAVMAALAAYFGGKKLLGSATGKKLASRLAGSK